MREVARNKNNNKNCLKRVKIRMTPCWGQITLFAYIHLYLLKRQWFEPPFFSDHIRDRRSEIWRLYDKYQNFWYWGHITLFSYINHTNVIYPPFERILLPDYDGGAWNEIWHLGGVILHFFWILLLNIRNTCQSNAFNLLITIVVSKL